MTSTTPTFDSIAPGRPGHDRLRAFLAEPEEVQRRAWAELRRRVDDRNEGGLLLEWDVIEGGPPPWRERARRFRRPPRPLRREAAPRLSADDPLLAIEPPLYVAALAGVEVPPDGGTICCPLPDHDDRSPSCVVYPDPERGFYCFGCHRGGSLYDFAAAFFGMGDRGEDFKRLRVLVAERLLSAGVGA